MLHFWRVAVGGRETPREILSLPFEVFSAGVPHRLGTSVPSPCLPNSLPPSLPPPNLRKDERGPNQAVHPLRRMGEDLRPLLLGTVSSSHQEGVSRRIRGCGGRRCVSIVPAATGAECALCVCPFLLLEQGEQPLVCPLLLGCQRVSCGASLFWDGTGAGCIPLQLGLVENAPKRICFYYIKSHLEMVLSHPFLSRYPRRKRPRW